MTKTGGERVFISYSRKDGAKFAAKFRDDLKAKGFSIWQDLVALEGGRDWWSQIESALKSKALQHFILVVTPQALASPIVRREIRLAHQEGKTFCPVKGPRLGDLNKLPRWIGNLYDLDLPENRKTLQRVLENQSRAKRVPMMAPEPPDDFVKRPTEFDALKAKLLNLDTKDAVAITAALRGAGGYGKTTLAKALAHDPDIQDAYFDGILWVELGEQGSGRVLALISDLIALITGSPAAMATIEAARTALAEALGDGRILLIIDDVWHRSDLAPFLQGGRNTTRLVTTRFDRELPDTAIRRRVDSMKGGEAKTLLSWGLPNDQAQQLGRELAKLASRLGEWAQLLKLVNGFLRNRVVKNREALHEAITGANRRLDEKGLVAFDARNDVDRTTAVARTIGVSRDLLDENQRARFDELGVFPEDADIPIGIVARLWAETGGLDEIETEDLLGELNDLSLLLSLDLEKRIFRFHDTTRHFLQEKAGKAGVVAQYKRLIQAMADIGGSQGTPDADRRYFYSYRLDHLAAAGERAALDDLLLDPGWLTAKLAATSSPQALVTDYEQFGRGSMQSLIGRTLRLTTGICSRDQRQLLPQLLGRLMACGDAAAPAFLHEARLHLFHPAILTQRPSLIPPGAETARLEGHTGPVYAFAVLADGRLASGSYDNTIRLWDPESGAEVARLTGAGYVNALAVLSDDVLISGCEDGIIRLWDLKTGEETANFAAHANRLHALAVLPDGRLASGSDDNTIRLWDPNTGAETARLTDTGMISALAVLPDGRLASGAYDIIVKNAVRLWDPKTGAETSRLTGTGMVRKLAVLPDGRLAAGSEEDNTIRLWDPNSGVESVRFEGEIKGVTALAVLPDGRIASGSYGAIQLWDPDRGAETARLEGFAGGVRALAALADGRLVSTSNFTIRLWDPKSAAATTRVEGHAGAVKALTVFADGRLASASSTIRLWDTDSGAETARFEGIKNQAAVLAVLPDGRLASGSYAHIQLWDPKSGAEVGRLMGHTDTVNALAVLPDGRLVSGSGGSGVGPGRNSMRYWNLSSGTEIMRLDDYFGAIFALAVLSDGRLASGSELGIQFWDPTSGAEAGHLRGHASAVYSLAVLPDGRLASGSFGKLQLWDPRSGAEVGRLIGHTNSVRALKALPDGRLASASHDKTIRLWDSKTSKEVACLEVDAAVESLVVLPDGRLVAGDDLGRLHWLEVVG